MLDNKITRWEPLVLALLDRKRQTPNSDRQGLGGGVEGGQGSSSVRYPPVDAAPVLNLNTRKRGERNRDTPHRESSKCTGDRAKRQHCWLRQLYRKFKMAKA